MSTRFPTWRDDGDNGWGSRPRTRLTSVEKPVDAHHLVFGRDPVPPRSDLRPLMRQIHILYSVVAVLAVVLTVDLIWTPR